MAKEKKEKKKDTGLEQNEKEGRSPGIFQKIFILGIVPALFIVTVLLILSMFTSFNVFEKAKGLTSSLPFMANEEQVENNAEQIVQLQAQIKEKEKQLEQLQAKLDQATKENKTLLTEQERLTFEIDKLQREQQQATADFEEVLTTYTEMDPAVSAPILVEMNENKALQILTKLDPKILSEILSNMNTVDAARYTELMAQ